MTSRSYGTVKVFVNKPSETYTREEVQNLCDSIFTITNQVSVSERLVHGPFYVSYFVITGFYCDFKIQTNLTKKCFYFFTRNVCVLRGRVATRHGRGIVGVRISREFQLSEGFTLSRKDGFFDFVASCDKRRVELTFGKSPYPFMSKSFNVIPNQVSFSRINKESCQHPIKLDTNDHFHNEQS